MAFRKSEKRSKFSDLIAVLAQSKDTDNALYQVIEEIIHRLDSSPDLAGAVQDTIIAGGSGGPPSGGGGGGTLGPHHETHEAGGTDRVPTMKYLGDYVAGTYNDGDVVVAADGIAYVCIKDGTTTAPEVWPGVGIATAVGPPGPTGPTGATGPQGPQGIPGSSTSGIHHTTHEPGGNDQVQNVAWTNLPNTFTQGQTFYSSLPLLTFWETVAPVDGRKWDLYTAGQQLVLQATNDIGTTATYPLIINRIGNTTIGRHLTVNGTIQFLAGTLAAQPVGLTADDVGKLYMVLDYNHLVRWNGAVWEFAPGDCGNTFFSQRVLAPQEAGWAACNGSSTDFMRVGGPTLYTQGLFLPNLNGVFLKGSTAFNGTVNGAVGPTITAGGAHAHTAYTDVQGAHSHEGGTDVQGAHSHGGGTDAVGAHGHNLTSSYVEYDHGGSSMYVPNSMSIEGTHSHTIGTDTQGSHGHNIGTTVNGGHGHNVGVNGVGDHTHGSTGGEPANLQVLIYFRR